MSWVGKHAVGSVGRMELILEGRCRPSVKGVQLILDGR